MKSKGQWEVYSAADGWRFRLRNLKNKKILLDGGEPYASKGNAKRAIKALPGYLDAPIVEI